MMSMLMVRSDGAESRELVGDLLLEEGSVEFHIAIEGDLRTRENAHGDIGLSNSGEAAGCCKGKFRRHQLVSHLGGATCNGMQAVVTHGCHSSCSTAG